MTLVTRLWGNKATPNLFTTVPARVRDQLALSPDDKVEWRLESGFAEVRKSETAARPKQGTTYTIYKQSRSASIYTVIPVAVMEQLRFTGRSRAEWELQGDRAVVRRA